MISYLVDYISVHLEDATCSIRESKMFILWGKRGNVQSARCLCKCILTTTNMSPF